MRKGFTLIELLAVIVILAIIALIATPIVLNIIEDTKESATLRSAEFYIDGVEHSIATAILKNKPITNGTYSIMEDGNICIGKLEDSLCKEDENIQGSGYVLEVNVKGEKPKEGTITISSGQVSEIELTISNKEIWKNPTTGNLAYKLAPGLYDDNDNLLISWEDLTSLEYQSFTYYEPYMDEETYEYYYEERTSPILNIDENGRLTTAVDQIEEVNYSAEYLKGKLVIDDSVTEIGWSAFWDCGSLKEIIIPNSVERIGVSAFCDCTSLTSIAIPESVTSIGDSAFTFCPNLESIIVDSNNLVYDSRDNSNAIIVTATNTLITGCKNTMIPNSVTSIGNFAFGGCSSLTSITIPKGVTSIGQYAFSGCQSLETVIMEDGVESISIYAFDNCTKLTSITIPESVERIGVRAFDRCPNLTTIYYNGTATGEPWSAPNATVIRDF